MIKICLIICSVFMVNSCFAQIKNKNDFIQSYKTYILKDSSVNFYYFPLEQFYKSDTSVSNLFFINFYNYTFSKYLSASNEPILYNYFEAKEIYRFIFLSNKEKPIILCILNDLEGVRLNIKILNGLSGYFPGKLITDTTITISNQEWNHFNKLLKKTDFWNLTSFVNYRKSFKYKWALEGSKSDFYQLVIRKGKKRNKIIKCGKYLFKLSRPILEKQNLHF